MESVKSEKLCNCARCAATRLLRDELETGVNKEHDAMMVPLITFSMRNGSDVVFVWRDSENPNGIPQHRATDAERIRIAKQLQPQVLGLLFPVGVVTIQFVPIL